MLYYLDIVFFAPITRALRRRREYKFYRKNPYYNQVRYSTFKQNKPLPETWRDNVKRSCRSAYVPEKSAQEKQLLTLTITMTHMPTRLSVMRSISLDLSQGGRLFLQAMDAFESRLFEELRQKIIENPLDQPA